MTRKTGLIIVAILAIAFVASIIVNIIGMTK